MSGERGKVAASRQAITADGGDVLWTGLAFDAFDTLIVAADAVDAVVEALRPACRSLTAA